MEFIEKFVAIGDMLFGGIFAAILVAVAVLGILVARTLSRMWIAAVVLAIGVVGSYVWSTMFVFSYPPNAPATTWMMAGWTLTPPAKDYLARSRDVAGYDAERRNGELVYAFEGDVQKVWAGSSMAVPKIAGQGFLALIVLGLAWALTLLGINLFGAKPKADGK